MVRPSRGSSRGGRPPRRNTCADACGIAASSVGTESRAETSESPEQSTQQRHAMARAFLDESSVDRRKSPSGRGLCAATRRVLRARVTPGVAAKSATAADSKPLGTYGR
jgi:hypothetical protein